MPETKQSQTRLDVWQFRWLETSSDGKRLYHKKIIGMLEKFPDEDDCSAHSRWADQENQRRRTISEP